MRRSWPGKSNRREAFAAEAAAVAQDGLAALARIAVEKSVLPFAADFRWLILAFHKFKFAISAWETPLTEQRRVTMKRLVSRRGSRINSRTLRFSMANPAKSDGNFHKRFLD
jgi:hypothetical protein